MDLLKLMGVVLAIVTTACTLTLDPDELQGELKTASDTTTATDVADVSDTSVTTTTTPDSMTTADDADASLPAVELAYPGALGCQLYFTILPVGGCAALCPALNDHWELVFDVANRPDIEDGDITWRFSIDTPSNTPLIIPSEYRNLEGRRVTLHIELPTCGTTAPADAQLRVETSINGGGFTASANGPLVLDMVNITCGSQASDCPAPPEGE